MSKLSKEDCFADLKRRILATELEPGADLDEVSIAEHYGLSRTPLREIFQRLAGEGYVRLEAHRGAKVASMDLATMRTFFQTAPMVYANIARLAAENRTGSEIDDLAAAQKDFRTAVTGRDPGAAALANHRFHAVIGAMAHNSYLVASLDRLLIDHTRMSQTFYRPTSPDERHRIDKAIEQHDAMISAIEAQEPALAVQLTLQHWDLSRDRMERFVRPDPLPHDLAVFEDRRHAV